METISVRRLTLALACALAALAMASPSARAQQPPPEPHPALTINQLDASAYPDLRAVVTALDAQGVPVTGLAVAQFQAFDGDTPVTVASVQSAQDASLRLSVVLAIDVSGSMAGEPLDRAKAAAIDFINALGPNDQASIVVFNQVVTPVVPFTGDRAALTSGIAGLQAIGGTALYDAVQTATYAARVANAPRSAVVLLSDGVNEYTDAPATADGSLGVAKGAGVPVFTIGFGAAPDVAYLQGLSATTQGQYHAANTANVASVYDDIATLLRHQYVLTLDAFSPADGKDANLRLIADIEGTAAAAVASFERGEAAPAPAAAATAPTPAPTPAKTSGKRSSTPLIAFSAVVALVLAGIAGGLAVAWRRQRRVLRRQLDVVAPNPAQAAAQPLPRYGGPSMSPASAETGTGRLVEQGGAEAGRVFQLPGGQTVIGSSPRRCTIVLEGDDVAPEHARIWLRDGRYLLHHAGGLRRKTYVGGKEADWVVLEAGDEVRVGRHVLVFEAGGGA